MTLTKTLALAGLLATGLIAGPALANDNVASPGAQYGTGASGSGSNGTAGPNFYEGRSAAPGYYRNYNGGAYVDGPVVVAPDAGPAIMDQDDED